MNEFRLSGVNYVSEWNGNDANAGTNPELPKKTINAAPTSGHTIVGAGTYLGNITGARNPITADGYVLLDGQNLFINNANAAYYTGFHFKNHLGQLGSNSNFAGFFNCIFENCPRIVFRAYANTGNVLLPGATFNFGSAYSAFQLNHSLFLENFIMTAGSSVTAFSFNYIEKGKRFTYVGTITLIQNCMINGLINVSGIDYELKKLANGEVRPDADPGILDLVTIYPAVYTNGNYAGEPKFIDVKNRLVQADSDLFKRVNATGFVGLVRPGSLVKKDGSDPNTFISTSQIDTSTDEWEIASGFSEGFIDIITRLSTNIVKIPAINYVGLLDFSGTAPDNVPDFFPSSYTPLTQDGLTPNRLCFKLRSSRSLAKPVFESDWDNDEAALGTTPATFYDQEWYLQPTITNVSETRYGNANPLTIGGSPQTISARWVHIRIRLTNLRTY